MRLFTAMAEEQKVLGALFLNHGINNIIILHRGDKLPKTFAL